MPFASKDLSVLAYANNFTLWHYTTPDTSVITAGYFNSSASMVRVNDLMMCNLNTGGTPSTVFYIVTGNTGTVVTVVVFVA